MGAEEYLCSPFDEDLARETRGGGEAHRALLDEGAREGAPLIEQQFVVEGECSGWRLDRFLQKKMRRLSRSRVQRVIRGDCDVDGRPGRPGMRVFAGQSVSFRRPAPEEPEVPRGVAVLHEDPSFYVLDKPAGLPIHPSARYHYSTLTAVLRERFPSERLQVAHRLDRETSGLILVARTAAAAVSLKKAFARRQIQKRYLAIVHGAVDFDERLLNQPIGPAQSRVRVRMAVYDAEGGAAGAVPAATAVRLLKRGQRYSLLECRPHTGRQHQIRVHLSAIGHPIVGDKLYPDEELFISWADGGDAAISGRLPLARHALHAAGLSFAHPTTGEPFDIASPLPPDLLAFLEKQII